MTTTEPLAAELDGECAKPFINDLDALADAAIVMGCGDDNPYR